MDLFQRRLFELGSSSLAKIVMLQDRNPHSRTYGCFDRKHWHLRITDFPSGMAQEYVLPLALAYANSFPGNRFHGEPALRDWCIAGIEYAMKSAHADGSCDDYYPFEKASGAAAFSLYAILETIGILDLDASRFASFIARRAEWLGKHQESGRLSNHEALIANCLYRAARLTGRTDLRELAENRLRRVLSWQNMQEGWFYEYEGADPGYLMLTIGNLAEIRERESIEQLDEPLRKAIGFLHALQPPDGWLGGEWTSRSTHNCFIHALEYCGRRFPQAHQVSDRLLDSLADPPDYGDDNIIAHHCWSFIKAGLLWNPERPQRSTVTAQSFHHAGLDLRQAGPYTLLTASKKGGCFRLYHDNKLIHSDTGISLLVKNGEKSANLVCHLWSEDNVIVSTSSEMSVSGRMDYAKSMQMTPLKIAMLRVFMLCLGRFHPDAVRRLLQSLLITGKRGSDFSFSRKLILRDDGLTVEDTIHGKGEIAAIGAGPSQTSIFTAMSRAYHPSQLQPWSDLAEYACKDGGAAFRCVRRIGYRQ